jgi:fructokinase
MADRQHIIVGIGELLWDLFPSGKQLGGAPSNFSYITNLLGDTGIPASRVGNDALGEEALQRLAQLGVSTDYLQRDFTHPTGTVKVEVDFDGQPRFEILHPVAWDCFQWTPAWQKLAAQADAVCFGSLAQRSAESRSTIRNFLRATRPDAVRVFDVNLRQNFYSKEVISESLERATIVKLNHDELPVVTRLLGWEHSGETESAGRLLSLAVMKLVCVTRGVNGSLLITRDECSEHRGFKVEVVDTVGAGDAFTAALLHGCLRAEPLEQINEDANRVGAWVASQSGGMPAVQESRLPAILARLA